MNIIIFGAPGSGKGTVAQKIEKEFGYPQISTGDILREEINNKTQLGEQISLAMKNGEYVDDQIMFSVLKQRLNQNDCQKGFILDGYPRTKLQAENLKNFCDIDFVFYLDVSEEEIKKRILTRKVCPNCRAVYNELNYKNPTCSSCGTKLIKRSDDTLEIITKRIEFFKKETLPVIDCFQEKIIKIGTNSKSSEEIYQKIREVLIRSEN